jgi:hypothetical protein
MQIQALVLAEAIAAAAAQPIPAETLDQLARALSNRGGVALDGRTAYLVLRDPLQADAPGSPSFLPTLVVGEMPTNQKSRRLRGVSDIAEYFALHNAKQGECPPSDVQHYIPWDEYDPALVRVAGTAIDLATFIEGDAPGRKVLWHPIIKTRVGTYLYRVERDGSIALYQFVGSQRWALVRATCATDRGLADIVDLPQIIQALRDTYGPFTLKPIPGHRVLMRHPPKR